MVAYFLQNNISDPLFDPKRQNDLVGRFLIVLEESPTYEVHLSDTAQGPQTLMNALPFRRFIR